MDGDQHPQIPDETTDPYALDEPAGEVAGDEVTASLQAALRHLREQAAGIDQLQTEERPDAAERIANDAAQLDEDLGRAGRRTLSSE